MLGEPHLSLLLWLLSPFTCTVYLTWVWVSFARPPPTCVMHVVCNVSYLLWPLSYEDMCEGVKATHTLSAGEPPLVTSDSRKSVSASRGFQGVGLSLRAALCWCSLVLQKEDMVTPLIPSLTLCTFSPQSKHRKWNIPEISGSLM